MLILGIDPGSKWCGYAILLERAEKRTDCKAFARVHLDFITLGEVQSDPDGYVYLADRLATVNRQVSPNPAHVAIESVAGYAYAPSSKRGGGQAVVKALLETSRVVGALESELRAHYAVDASRTALQCRGIVVGKSRCGDADVKVAVKRIVNGWPKRSNVHQRDAALCAIAYSFVTRHTRNH